MPIQLLWRMPHGRYGDGVKISREGATGNIFISYRREDSAAYAGRLCDHLNTLMGADRVFMDFEDIAPGQRFAQTIDDTMARCDTALIVIGPRWAEILHQRAQEQQPDYVCREIEGALARQITIVPVLVGGASMAQLTGLPDSLAALSQYEAAELRDSTFREDCVRLARHCALPRRRKQNLRAVRSAAQETHRGGRSRGADGSVAGCHGLDGDRPPGRIPCAQSRHRRDVCHRADAVGPRRLSGCVQDVPEPAEDRSEKPFRHGSAVECRHALAGKLSCNRGGGPQVGRSGGGPVG